MRSIPLFVLAILLTGCGEAPTANQANTNNANMAASPTPAVQNLTVTERPAKISEQMAGRGQQDEAKPVLQVLEPKQGSTVNSSTVKVRLSVSGDLKGYMPGMDTETKMGNHIHVILDNQPYEAYYNLDQPFELRNVSEGEHTLRFFPSRPWHESYKNEGAFQMVTFTVKNGGSDANRPTTTSNGNTMASAAANANASATPEGKEMQPSSAGKIDRAKPLLTYSRPKGEYKGADADAIMIDFWLVNAKLVGEGGEYRVRYAVDGGEARFIDKWKPIWLSGWTAGTHTIMLELVDGSENVIDNGGYNLTVRDIMVLK
jgi:hypothetical protein